MATTSGAYHVSHGTRCKTCLHEVESGLGSPTALSWCAIPSRGRGTRHDIKQRYASPHMRNCVPTHAATMEAALPA